MLLISSSTTALICKRYAEDQYCETVREIFRSTICYCAFITSQHWEEHHLKITKFQLVAPSAREEVRRQLDRGVTIADEKVPGKFIGGEECLSEFPLLVQKYLRESFVKIGAIQ